MCEEVLDRRETNSFLMGTEFSADALAARMKTLENATFIEFQPTESFKTKVGMLSARLQAIAEEIERLDPEKENL